MKSSIIIFVNVVQDYHFYSCVPTFCSVQLSTITYACAKKIVVFFFPKRYKVLSFYAVSVRTMSGVTSTTFARVVAMYVPVGASFQRLVRQRRPPDVLDMAYPDTPRIIRPEPFSLDFEKRSFISRPTSGGMTVSRTTLNVGET